MGRRRGSIRNMNKDSKISIHVFVIWWTLFVLQAELVDSLHCSTYQSHVSIRPVCKSNLTQQSSASSGRLFKVLHTRDIIIQETLLLLLLLPASSYSTPSPPPILPILLLSSPPPPLALQPVVTKVSPDLKQPTRSEPGSVRASDAAAGWRSSTGGWSDGAFRLRVVQLQTNRQISGVSQLVWHLSVRNVGGAYDWIFTGLHR